MSLSRKIVLILILPLFVEIIFLAALIDADRRSARYRLWQGSSTEAILATTHVLELVLDAEAGTRGYIATGDSTFLERYDRAIGALPGNFRLLDRVSRAESGVIASTVPDRHQASDLDRAARLVVEDLRGEIGLMRAGRQGEALARLKAGRPGVDRFRSEMTAFLGEEMALQREQHAALDRAEASARFVIIALLAGNLIITLSLVIFLMRNVASRIRHTLDNMARLPLGEPLLPQRSSQDEIGRLDLGFHEMAERLRAADEQLRREKVDLQLLNAEKNRFIGMAAHDLRNPLMAIMVLMEALRRRSVSEADQRLLEQITKSTRSMKTLVDDFLDVSAIEAGELRLRRERIELATVVDECIVVQQPLAAQKGIALRLDLRLDGASEVMVFADPDKIGQVMTNLITNALKFSPENDTVDVSVVSTGAMVQVTVKDRGPGISLDETSLLFQPFSVTSNRSAGDSHMGLGLAICRRIIEGHGGRIWVESHVGEGSAFSFELARLTDVSRDR